jgi:hypothetical protein
MWHVLGHALDPLALLREAHAQLRPGGRLVLEAPNVESVGARLLGGRRTRRNTPNPVSHFGPRSMRAALESSGYAVVEIETIADDYDDRTAMRLRPRGIVCRVARAVALRTLAANHLARGELLRVVAERVR